MLKLINKHYSQYHVLKESQTLCSGTIQMADAKFEFEFPEDLETLQDKEGKR